MLILIFKKKIDNFYSDLVICSFLLKILIIFYHFLMLAPSNVAGILAKLKVGLCFTKFIGQIEGWLTLQSFIG